MGKKIYKAKDCLSVPVIKNGKIVQRLSFNDAEHTLNVFEKDIQSLKENQRVMFRILGDNNEYYATLKSLGKNVDNETKTILCFAEIDDLLKNNFINNTYVEARVITSRDSVYAVPEEAILRSGESRYILVLRNKENENYYLEKTSVETGRTANGFIEIKNEIKGQLLLKGAYNIVIE